MSICLLILFLAAASIYAVVVQQDLTYRKIPNGLALAIVVIAVAKWAILQNVDGALWAVASATIVFMVTATLFWRGWMGGGDVKLMTATSFLVGAGGTSPSVIYTAMVGGLVAIVVVVVSLLGRFRVGGRDVEPAVMSLTAKPTVPYGVAIASAGVLVLFQQYLSR